MVGILLYSYIHIYTPASYNIKYPKWRLTNLHPNPFCHCFLAFPALDFPSICSTALVNPTQPLLHLAQQHFRIFVFLHIFQDFFLRNTASVKRFSAGWGMRPWYKYRRRHRVWMTASFNDNSSWNNTSQVRSSHKCVIYLTDIYFPNTPYGLFTCIWVV